MVLYDTCTPDYIVGFVDGEGCFTLHIIKKSNSPFGICLTPSFSVSQNTTSIHVLPLLQTMFGCGCIRKDRNTSKYEVRDLASLQQKIIPFFQKNQLKTAKKQDFVIFCKICQMIHEKHHFTYQGVVTLVDLAYSMNKNGVNRRKSKSQILLELKKPTNF